MKVLKTLAALVFLLGAVYVAAAVLMLLTVDQTSQLMGAGVGPDFRRRLILAAAALVVIGLPSAVGGAGLFMAREWARSSWPLIAGLAVLAHAVWFTLDLYRGGVEFWDWWVLAAVCLVYIGSAIYLTRPATEALFRKRAEGAT